MKKKVKLKAIPFNPKKHIRLGDYLRDLRKYHEMTLFDFTDKVGWPWGSLSALELGRGKISPLYFKKLVAVFNINSTLLGRLKVINLNQLHTGMLNRRQAEIGQYIRDVRQANKINMVKMADLLQVDYATIVHLEYSEETFSDALLNKFIKILKLPRIQAYKLKVNNKRLREHLKKYPKPKRTVYDHQRRSVAVKKEDTIHAKFLKQLRKDKGLTQRELSEYLDNILEHHNVRAIENNRYRITISKLKLLKKKLKLSTVTYNKLLKFCIKE